MNSILRTLLVFVLLAAAGFAADFAETKKKAEAGDSKAQYNLGHMYNAGEDMPKDTAEAVKWLRLAADQGFAKAQSSLGLMYQLGEGVLADSAEAIKWYRLAAVQGDARGQNSLGMCYYYGDGLSKNLVQAHIWFNIAGANGHKTAKENLADVEKEMTSEQKAEAMKLARELFAKLPKGK